MHWPPDDYPGLGPLQDKIQLPAPTEADRVAGALALIALMRPEKMAAALASVSKPPKPSPRKS